MNILVSNDDGYRAPGIAVLAEALSLEHEVSVVAPERNCSGASNSLTLERGLRASKVAENSYFVDGTPTDTVHLAVTGLLDKTPDMVVSGINAGANMGDDVLYSGTVAAAMEGRHLGLPAIAVSMDSFTPEHYETAAKAVVKLLADLKQASFAANTILNINVPDIPWTEIKGFKATRLGNRHKSEGMIIQKDPRGDPMYWVGPPGEAQDAGEGTDFHAVSQHYVSITPLQIDLTRYNTLNELEDWLKIHI
ncbi:MAG: 5'/3'-nucleotidase SurE [Gammaproteobacteria bacterium]|nr:5'/3'-nucleotidase SurE [Gammaproteobacteria bacterium]MBT8134287.1 5'/3'-nucleotidase SurE [Gammaproteobacteria bacterium]NNJ49229.1 5'/3'-nucleotidase SurE [Gammaproteobacteria bacterium]